MKKLLFMFLTIFVVLSMSACGTADNAGSDDPRNGANGTEVEEQENNEDGVEEAENGGVVDEEESTADGNVEVITVEGTFSGEADPHTIEVITEDGPLALQTLEVTDVNFEEIVEDSNVTIEYYVNDEGQNVLTSITVTE